MTSSFERRLPAGILLDREIAADYADVSQTPPRFVVAPRTDEDCAKVLQLAAEHRLAVLPWGGGRHQRIGNLPRADVVLRTEHLSGIVEHDIADQTITVRGGTRLADVVAAADAVGQWLPFDPPGSPQATVGGIVATGINGPLRSRYGLPSEHLLGTRAVYSDGSIAKSGGRLVKNVTGFDLHRLQHGSLGTLAVITEVSLRLYPRPQRKITLPVTIREETQVDAMVEAICGAGMRPAACVLRPGVDGNVSATGLVRLIGDDATVARQERDLRALLGDELGGAIVGDDDARLWRELPEEWGGGADEVVYKLAFLPISEEGSRVSYLMRRVAVIAGSVGGSVYVEPCLGLLRVVAPMTVAERLLPPLSELTRSVESSLTLESSPTQFRRDRDVYPGGIPALAIHRKLKRALDPAGILSPGRIVREEA